MGPSMVSWDLLVHHLHGLCCVVFFAVFYDNELIAVSMLVGVKDFILC